MDLNNYLQQLEEASKNQDPSKMMSAMQKFFSEIHNTDETGGKLLGLYSMAQQLESFGINTAALKNAVYARIASQYNAYSATWENTAVGLNSLLSAEGKPGRFLIPVK